MVYLDYGDYCEVAYPSTYILGRAYFWKKNFLAFLEFCCNFSWRIRENLQENNRNSRQSKKKNSKNKRWSTTII